MNVEDEGSQEREYKPLEGAHESDQESKDKKLFLLFSFLTAFFNGTGFFLNGYLSMKYGIIGCFLLWLPNSVFWALYHLWNMIQRKRSRGYFYDINQSVYYDAEKQKINWYGLFLVFVRSAFSMVVLILFFISQSAAAKAGLNQGIVTALFSASIMFSAVLFYFCYDEQLNLRHLIAIFAFTGSVIFIGMNGKGSDDNSFSSESIGYYVSLSISLSLLLGFVLALSQVATKYIQASLQQDPFELTMNVGLFYLPYTLPLFCYYLYLGYSFDLEDYFIMFGACLFLQIGLAFNIKGLMLGPGSIVFAISNLGTIVQTVWIVAIQGIIPTITQLVSLVLALLGSSVVTEVDKALFAKKN